MNFYLFNLESNTRGLWKLSHTVMRVPGNLNTSLIKCTNNDFFSSYLNHFFFIKVNSKLLASYFYNIKLDD